MNCRLRGLKMLIVDKISLSGIAKIMLKLKYLYDVCNLLVNLTINESKRKFNLELYESKSYRMLS
tara:strand:- start:171 stop:365 length:195 start_codon:yes stop_codon:yes gene_type:complete